MLANQEDPGAKVDGSCDENDTVDCSYTRLDRIRNVVIREQVGVAPPEEKLRETKLRWFGHVKRSVNKPSRRYETINLLHCRR